MADKTIKKGVRQGGRLFRAGNKQDVEDLEKALSSEDIKRLKKAGAIEGDFKAGRKADESVRRAVMGSETGPARPQGQKRTATTETKAPAKTQEPPKNTEPPKTTASGSGAPWEPKA